VKISSPMLSTPETLTYARPARVAAQGSAPTSRAAQLETSDFLSELHAAAAKSPWGEVRAEKVAAAKADIANGTLGSDADFAATIDALLREF